ncbi:MAG: cyclase family protein [Candidatus Obscuribacterales bacterium]|nr:cyclase family protein [Candidatus Obscuribacterales bacterium]
MRDESVRIIDVSKPWSSLQSITLDNNSEPHGTRTICREQPHDSIDEATSAMRASQALRAMKTSAYFGVCFVVDVQECKSEITSETLYKIFDSLSDEMPNGVVPQKVLLHTGYKGEGTDYPCLSSDALLFLEAKGIKLVGIDCPSIDRSTGHPVNEAFMKSRNMIWIANLELSHVKPNRPYTLSALPLIPHVPGEIPTRAILIPFSREDEEE